MLIEISQTEQLRDCVLFTYTWNLNIAKQKQADRDREQISGFHGGGVG